MVKYYLRLSLFVKFVDVFGPTDCRGLPERRPANTHASLGKSPARAGDLHVLRAGPIRTDHRANQQIQTWRRENLGERVRLSAAVSVSRADRRKELQRCTAPGSVKWRVIPFSPNLPRYRARATSPPGPLATAARPDLRPAAIRPRERIREHLTGVARVVAGSRARAEEEAEGHRRRDDSTSELPIAAADLARTMALPRSATTTCSPAQARAPPFAPWRAELERRGGGGARAPRSEEGRGGRGTARPPGSDPPEAPARLADRRRRAQQGGGRSLGGAAWRSRASRAPAAPVRRSVRRPPRPGRSSALPRGRARARW